MVQQREELASRDAIIAALTQERDAAIKDRDDVERELEQMDQQIEEFENLLLTTPSRSLDGIQAVLEMAVTRFRSQTVTDPGDVFYDYGDARILTFLERATDDLRSLLAENQRQAS